MFIKRKKLTLVQCCELNYGLHFMFMAFSNNVIFMFQNPVQFTVLHLFIVFPWSLPISDNFLNLSPVLMSLVFLKSTGEAFYRSAFNWDFLIIQLGLWIFKKNITEVKLPSHVSHQRVHDTTWLIIVGEKLDRLVTMVSAWFPHQEVILSPFPHYKYNLITE